MYLVNNPVTVVHGSGTIISATLSLGYDISHVQVEELLKKAAMETGLEEPFVLVIDLNDFSVSYRVGGFTNDVNHLLTIKSSLLKNILVMLHASGIEIVSPNFMNQRLIAEGAKIIPSRRQAKTQDNNEKPPEDVIFDKAGTAAEYEQLKQELLAAEERLEVVAGEKKSSKGEDQATLKLERKDLKARIEEIREILSSPPLQD